MSDTKMRLQIVREVAEKADAFYGKAEALGSLAAQQITGRHRKQVTDLENVANTALKVTDVLNHIKNQTARRDWGDFGHKLLAVIGTELKKDKDEICAKLALADAHERGKQEQQVHLYLIREFMRQLAAQYEYQCLLKERTPA